MKPNDNQLPPSVYPRGIYLLPSILTGCNIVLGFYSIVLVLSRTNGENAPLYYFRAGLLIIFAACFDAIDGRVARLTKTTSPFGAQLDSIADVVSFGLAPSVLIYSWALSSFTRFGWVAALIYLLSGAIRLARFNVLEDLHSYSSSQYFIGLPIPAAAICIALIVMLEPDFSQSYIPGILVLSAVYMLSYLMVSKCRFRSFKDIDWRRRRPVGSLVITMILLGIILHEPVYVLSLLMFVYVISGMMMRLSPHWMGERFEVLDKWFTGIRVLDDSDEKELDQQEPDVEENNSDELTTPDEPPDPI
ncbi:CDP-diacylglycerol--serine O-phosphatidyltransferase [bacterium]|nr:CDP-diacylglycerol--serine O-phosphatidyltransferase [candidate division CSSED10-310 bacterium]